MANRIYIQVVGTDVDATIQCPLMEDISLELGSSFGSWGELAPALESLNSVAKNIYSGVGTVGKGFMNYFNAFDLPRWQKTDPVKLTTDLYFYTKTSAQEDVYNNMIKIMSLCILTEDGSGSDTYILPGASSQNAGALISGQNKTNTSSQTPSTSKDWGKNIEAQGKTIFEDPGTYGNKSKLVSIFIPGIVYLPYAILKTCTPIFSKQKTESGFPLWGKINVLFEGLYPASTGIFTETRNMTNDFMTKLNIANSMG